MKTNSLKLNDSKTEVITFGSAKQLKKRYVLVNVWLG